MSQTASPFTPDELSIVERWLTAEAARLQAKYDEYEATTRHKALIEHAALRLYYVEAAIERVQKQQAVQS